MIPPCYTVAELAQIDPATHQNWIVAVSDGNVGAPCLAWSDGKHWLRLVAGLPVAAS
jgi:hypothetical protein